MAPDKLPELQASPQMESIDPQTAMDSPSNSNQPNAADLLISINSVLNKQASSAVFAIGGVADIAPPASTSGQRPVVIRWNSGEPSHSRNVALPVGEDAVSQTAFSQLLKDCEPATYGRGAEEVFDETYRRAGKLAASQFSTSFNPYERGVMDTISQAFVHTKYRGIRAELYNLSIYSGPSGMFKPHVDTPRSGKQMGSLVVCLPHPHKGGQLAVRHRGREVLFDWASENPSKVKWAAFYSDCEHEVLEVKQGHRLTLTYNLYWTAFGPASMSHNLNAFEQESLPFYAELEKLLKHPAFLPNGGVIGFTCTHAYPHTSSSSYADVHHGLKGLDMVVYQALKRLIGSVWVSSVLDDSQYQADIEEQSCYSLAEEDISDVDDAGNLMTTKACLKIIPSATIMVDHDESDPLDPETLHVDVRRGDAWEHEQAYRRLEVTWLNHSPCSKRSTQELAVGFHTYGNEPGIDTYYSSAVIAAVMKGKENSAQQ